LGLGVLIGTKLSFAIYEIATKFAFVWAGDWRRKTRVLISNLGGGSPIAQIAANLAERSAETALKLPNCASESEESDEFSESKPPVFLAGDWRLETNR
jgi:hypothetical protein